MSMKSDHVLLRIFLVNQPETWFRAQVLVPCLFMSAAFTVHSVLRKEIVLYFASSILKRDKKLYQYIINA